MTERQSDDRRRWKAQTFDYDYYMAAPGRGCTVCLTDKQRELLLGLTEPLAWSTRWWSTIGTQISQDEIDEFRDDMRRRIIMACCGDEQPIQFMYSDDGTLLRSDDGGVTFYPAPSYDPRVYSPTFPPIPGSDGSDKRCIAATGAAALVKEQVGDQLTDDMSRFTLGELINTWVRTMLETSNPFNAIITVVSNQIFALAIAVLRPALTDDVYAQFQCILYCNMGENASVNQAQWASIRSDITSQITGIAGLFLEHLCYLLGSKGLTNLVRAGGASTGDCSDCDCDYCYTWDFSISDGDWETQPHWPGGGGAGATWAGGWNSAHPGGSAGDTATCYIFYDLPATVNITKLVVTFTNSGMTHDSSDFAGAIAAGSPFVATDIGNHTQILLYAYDPPGGAMTMHTVEIHSNSPFPEGMTGGEVC